MKLRIDNCPNCKRRTLQAEEVVEEYVSWTKLDGADYRKVKAWFCSICAANLVPQNKTEYRIITRE